MFAAHRVCYNDFCRFWLQWNNITQKLNYCNDYLYYYIIKYVKEFYFGCLVYVPPEFVLYLNRNLYKVQKKVAVSLKLAFSLSHLLFNTLLFYSAAIGQREWLELLCSVLSWKILQCFKFYCSSQFPEITTADTYALHNL